MKKFFIALAKTVSGKKRFQPFFDAMHGHMLTAMNMGKPAAHVSLSGETAALKVIKEKLRNSPLCIFDVGANVGDYTETILSIFQLNHIYIYIYMRSSRPRRLSINCLDGFERTAV